MIGILVVVGALINFGLHNLSEIHPGPGDSPSAKIITLSIFLLPTSNSSDDTKAPIAQASTAALTQIKGPEAAALEAYNIPEFAADLDPPVVASQRDLSLSGTLRPVFALGDFAKDKVVAEQARDALTEIIKKFPDSADCRYLWALSALAAGRPEPKVIRGELDRAIALFPTEKDHVAAKSISLLLALRAKLSKKLSDDAAALTDLENAIQQSNENAGSVFYAGGFGPNDQRNTNVIEQSDLDSLVAKYPTDYRPLLARGIFFYAFTSFDQKYTTQALADLMQASSISPNSGIVYEFRAAVSEYSAYRERMQGKQSQSPEFLEKALTMRKRALALGNDPFRNNFSLAEDLLSLENYTEAIEYFDKALAINPLDHAAIHDRAASKMNSGDPSGAIADYTRAIELERNLDINVLSSDDAYEERAKAHAALLQFDQAVLDYNAAIGRQIGKHIILMQMTQFYVLYPQLVSMSERELDEAMRQKYQPLMSPSEFIQELGSQYSKHKEYKISGIAALFKARGEAHKELGHKDLADADFARAIYEASPEK